MTSFVVGKEYQTRDKQFKLVYVGPKPDSGTVFSVVGVEDRLLTRRSDGTHRYKSSSDVVEIPVTYTEVRHVHLSGLDSGDTYVSLNKGKARIEFTFDADGECIAVKLL